MKIVIVFLINFKILEVYNLESVMAIKSFTEKSLLCFRS